MLKFVTKLPSLLFLLFLFSCLYWKYDAIKDQTSLIVANMFQTMTMYTGDSKEIRRYNEALFMAKKGDFQSAESLLAPLLNMSETQSKSDIYELYGDVLYSLQKPDTIVEVYYKKSLELKQDNLRVEKKLSLMKELSEQKSGSGSQKSSSGETLVPQDISGSIEKREKLDELNHFSQQRGDYMNYDISLTSKQDALIKSSIDILEGGEQKRDW